MLRKASVRAELRLPDGSTMSLPLARSAAGVYEASIDALLPGIYRFTVKARGTSSRRAPFTREQVLTGAVWRGGDRPPPR